MGRRKKGLPVSGWICLDKPFDLTSTQAVGRVRRLFDAQKAGHAGTLDPLATGVLPIALGEATKTVPFLMESVKTYRFLIRWGETTDTFDQGVSSLAAHAAYIEGLGWENWDPREFLEGFGRQTGQRLGVAFAASFEVFPMGWGE